MTILEWTMDKIHNMRDRPAMFAGSRESFAMQLVVAVEVLFRERRDIAAQDLLRQFSAGSYFAEGPLTDEWAVNACLLAEKFVDRWWIPPSERIVTPKPVRTIYQIINDSALTWANLSPDELRTEHELLRRALQNCSEQTSALVAKVNELSRLTPSTEIKIHMVDGKATHITASPDTHIVVEEK